MLENIVTTVNANHSNAEMEPRLRVKISTTYLLTITASAFTTTFYESITCLTISYEFSHHDIQVIIDFKLLIYAEVMAFGSLTVMVGPEAKMRERRLRTI